MRTPRVTLMNDYQKEMRNCLGGQITKLHLSADLVKLQVKLVYHRKRVTSARTLRGPDPVPLNHRRRGQQRLRKRGLKHLRILEQSHAFLCPSRRRSLHRQSQQRTNPRNGDQTAKFVGSMQEYLLWSVPNATQNLHGIIGGVALQGTGHLQPLQRKGHSRQPQSYTKQQSLLGMDRQR